MGLDGARQSAREQSALVGRGADPAGAAQERKDAETFTEIATEWLERHGKVNKSARTVRDDQSMLSRHVLPAIGSMKAAEVSKRDVIRILDAVASADDARSARLPPVDRRKLTHRPNRVFELVRSIFRWSIISSTSLAICGPYLAGSCGFSLLPWPRQSMATTRWFLASASATPTSTPRPSG